MNELLKLDTNTLKTLRRIEMNTVLAADQREKSVCEKLVIRNLSRNIPRQYSGLIHQADISGVFFPFLLLK